MISLLHTTAQPEKCEKTAAEWLRLSNNPDEVEHVLAYERSAFRRSPDTWFKTSAVCPVVIPADGESPVSGWNLAACASHGDILVVMADDLFPCQDWDVQIHADILEWERPQTQKVLWYSSVDAEGNDLWPDIMTHPILTRAYYLLKGYVFHPAYFARFADPEFTEVAKRDGVIIDKRNNGRPWRHENHQVPGDWHPSTDRINALHARDSVVYEKRKQAGFPRDWEPWRAEVATHG